jgi:hypothetical protein
VLCGTNDLEKKVMSDERILEWLVGGDPSVAWQTHRDLLKDQRWESIRSRVAIEGWGRGLLDAQDPDGRWGRGLYTPKWTSTNYTLLQLRRLGLEPANPQARAGVQHLLDDARWVDGGVSYWVTHDFAERCVNGMVLSIASYFEVQDDRINDIAEMLLRSRVEDGGWNCNDYRGDTHHSSFNTTISVLEGLVLWKGRTGSSEADEAIARGQEVLIEHGMFRSHTTGQVIDENWTKFSFPPRWHYDILRGLDHFRDACLKPDPRCEEAVDVIRRRRRPDGLWPIGPRHTGVEHFRMEEGRKPGRWNTLRSLRVLDWWGTQG